MTTEYTVKFRYSTEENNTYCYICAEMIKHMKLDINYTSGCLHLKIKLIGNKLTTAIFKNIYTCELSDNNIYHVGNKNVINTDCIIDLFKECLSDVDNTSIYIDTEGICILSCNIIIGKNKIELYTILHHETINDYLDQIAGYVNEIDELLTDIQNYKDERDELIDQVIEYESLQDQINLLIADNENLETENKQLKEQITELAKNKTTQSIEQIPS